MTQFIAAVVVVVVVVVGATTNREKEKSTMIKYKGDCFILLRKIKIK